MARNVVGRLKFNDCVIYQANETQTELLQVAALGEKNPFGRNILNPLKIPFGSGITGQVAARREAIVVHDLSLDKNYITDTQQARSEICVPILCNNRVVGVIDSEHPDPNAFGDPELEVLITIAALTGAKLELLAEAERSQQRYHVLVEAHAQLSRETTSRKALEAELFNTRKLEAVGRLTGRFAHEFNNLFTVISGNLEFLEADIPAGLPTETLVAAQTAAQRGVAMIQSMLAFSQRTRLTPQTADLNTFIRSVTGNSEYGAMTLNLARDLHPVNVDLNVLEKVMSNLLGNARDAMESIGTISISTMNVSQGLRDQQTLSTTLLPGDYVRLSVSDNGTGIAQESLQQIFDPFYTTKPVGDGTGLGLSMVLGFMRQSGGTVEVKSDLGEGSTFHLYFPAG